MLFTFILWAILALPNHGEGENESYFCPSGGGMEKYTAYPRLFTKLENCREIFQLVTNFNCLNSEIQSTPDKCFSDLFRDELAFLLNSESVFRFNDRQLSFLMKNDRVLSASKIHILLYLLNNQSEEASLKLANQILPYLKNTFSLAIKNVILQLFTKSKPMTNWPDADYQTFSALSDAVSVDILTDFREFISPFYLNNVEKFLGPSFSNYACNLLSKNPLLTSQRSATSIFLICSGFNGLSENPNLIKGLDDLKRFSDLNLNNFQVRTLLGSKKFSWEDVLSLGTKFLCALDQTNLPDVSPPSLTFSLALEKYAQSTCHLPVELALEIVSQISINMEARIKLDDELFKNSLQLLNLFDFAHLEKLSCQKVIRYFGIIPFHLLRWDQIESFYNYISKTCFVLSPFDALDLQALKMLGPLVKSLSSISIEKISKDTMEEIVVRSEERSILPNFRNLPLKTQKLSLHKKLMSLDIFDMRYFIMLSLEDFFTEQKLENLVRQDVGSAYKKVNSFYISYPSTGVGQNRNLVKMRLSKPLMYLYYDSLVCEKSHCPFQKLTPNLIQSLGNLRDGIRIKDITSSTIYSIFSLAEALSREKIPRRISRALTIKIMSSYEQLSGSAFSLDLFEIPQLLGLGWQLLVEFPPPVFRKLREQKCRVVITLIGENVSKKFPKAKRKFLVEHYMNYCKDNYLGVEQMDFDQLGRLSCDFSSDQLDWISAELIFNNLDKFSECCFDDMQIFSLRRKLQTSYFLNPLVARALGTNYFYLAPVTSMNGWFKSNTSSFDLARELYPQIQSGFAEHRLQCKESLFLLSDQESKRDVRSQFEIVASFVWRTLVKKRSKSCEKFPIKDFITCADFRALGEGNVIWTENDIASIPPCEIKKCIGFISDNIHLFHQDKVPRAFLDRIFRELIVQNQTNLLSISNIYQIGNLITLLNNEELKNLKLFNSVDFISYLESFEWSHVQSVLLYEKVEKFFDAKSPKQDVASFSDKLFIIGSLICGISEDQKLFQWIGMYRSYFKNNLNSFKRCPKTLKQALEVLLTFNLNTSRFSFAKNELFHESMNSYTLQKLLESDTSLVETIDPTVVAKWDPKILISINFKLLGRLTPEQIGAISPYQWKYMSQFVNKDLLINLIEIYLAGSSAQNHPFIIREYLSHTFPKVLGNVPEASFDKESSANHDTVQGDDGSLAVTQDDDYKPIYQNVHVHYITTSSSCQHFPTMIINIFLSLLFNNFYNF